MMALYKYQTIKKLKEKEKVKIIKELVSLKNLKKKPQ